MGDRAKLLKNGDSQTVELPRKFHFDEGQEEVDIRRQGSGIILEPVKRTWSKKFLDVLGSAPDFPYPDEPPPVEPAPNSIEIPPGHQHLCRCDERPLPSGGGSYPEAVAP